MSKIKVYEFGSLEHLKLKVFSEVCNRYFFKQRKAFYVSVEETYFDYGQNWKYSALITEDMIKEQTWQSVCPRDYENILECDSFAQIEVWALKYAERLIDGEISQHITF